MHGEKTDVPRGRFASLAGSLAGLAFAPVQAVYLVSLLGLVAALAAFRAFGPLKRRPARSMSQAPR